MLKHLYILFCFISICFCDIWACTSAIIGADMNPYGRPLLWKNRDTSASDNKIEYLRGENGDFGRGIFEKLRSVQVSTSVGCR